MTAKKKPANRRRKPQLDPIEEVREEVRRLGSTLESMILARPSMPMFEDARREVGKELEKLQLRITEAFDAKPLTYLDSQRIASLHNRVNKIDEMLTVDARQREIFQSRIQALEERQVIEAKNLATFVSLGFWARLRWLVFGAKGLLSSWPVRELKSFDDIFKGGNEG